MFSRSRFLVDAGNKFRPADVCRHQWEKYCSHLLLYEGHKRFVVYSHQGEMTNTPPNQSAPANHGKWKPITIVSATCVAVLLVWAILYFIRSVNGHGCCICNLQQIDGAKLAWALKLHKTDSDVPTLGDLHPFVLPDIQYKDTPLVFKCPKGGTYTIGRVGEPPKCSVGGREHTFPSP